jgi:hypothetical protein
MDGARLDALARSLSDTRSRRATLVAVLGGVGPLLGLPGEAAGKKGQKKSKRKPLRRNEFGCVNVGGRCQGNDANCCSGICTGKKPKKGEKDKSTCVAHDQSSCLPGQTSAGCSSLSEPLSSVPCTTSTGRTGQCNTTTGNAGYCVFGGLCIPCTKDADCISFCGPQAACTQCFRACAQQGLTTQCTGPDECTFPI